MEENNQNIKKKNPFIVIVSILLIISIGCTIYGYLNKDNKKTIINNEITNTNENNDTQIDLSENVTTEDLNYTQINDNETEDDEENSDDYLIKKDEDYEYKYRIDYFDDEKTEIFDGEILYFKIRNKDVLDKMDEYIGVIKEVKKYKEFIAIVADCDMPLSYTSLYIFDYEGRLLFVNEDYSVVDPENGKDSYATDDKDSGHLEFDSYTYSDESKILEMKYNFDILRVIGENQVASIPDNKRKKLPFCVYIIVYVVKNKKIFLIFLFIIICYNYSG